MSFQSHLDQAWIGAWLDTVADGYGTLSQRAVSAIDRHGGIEVAISAAKSRNVHLVEMSDDSGKRLVAASRAPFRALC